MSSEKPKPTAADSQKVFDVAKPGKSSPDATSKPIIITNRPVLKDPMMTDEPSGPPPVNENVASSKPSIRIKISPLGDESEAPAEPLVRDSIEDKPQEAPVEDKPEAAVEPDAEPAVEESKEPEPVAESETVAAEAAEPSKESVESGKPAPEPAKETTAEDNSQDDGDQPTAQRADQKEDEEDLRKEIERQTELQKIIESKKYFLPINAVSKRRSKRHIIIGALLIIVLALVWADIALDSGMITIHGVKPLTHFFSR